MAKKAFAKVTRIVDCVPFHLVYLTYGCKSALFIVFVIKMKAKNRLLHLGSCSYLALSLKVYPDHPLTCLPIIQYYHPILILHYDSLYLSRKVPSLFFWPR